MHISVMEGSCHTKHFLLHKHCRLDKHVYVYVTFLSLFLQPFIIPILPRWLLPNQLSNHVGDGMIKEEVSTFISHDHFPHTTTCALQNTKVLPIYRNWVDETGILKPSNTPLSQWHSIHTMSDHFLWPYALIGQSKSG